MTDDERMALRMLASGVSLKSVAEQQGIEAYDTAHADA